MKKTTKANIFIIALLIALVTLGIHFIKKHNTPHTDQTDPVLVQLGTPQQIMLTQSISSSGNLEALQTAHLSAKVSGYITKINYKEGASVPAGALLIQLDNHKEQAAVDSAQAQNDMSALKYKQLTKMYHQHFEAYDDYFGAKINLEKDRAALETAQVDLADKSIRAPFAGVAGEKLIHVGDFVQPGTVLLTLTDLRKLRVTYSVPAAAIPSLKLDQPITVTTTALNNNTFYGKVSYISPTVDTTSQTVTVHADIDNTEKKLKPGLFVSIHQTLGAAIPAIVVPVDAVFASITGYYVLGVKNGKTYEIPITIADKLNKGMVIKKGLAANDLFIVQGQNKVQVGDTVRIQTTTRSTAS